MNEGNSGSGARDPGHEAGRASPESRAPGPGPIARLADFPPDGLLAATLDDGTPVCLVRQGDAVYALHDRCSHADYALSAGELLPDGTVQCLWHGATFDCRSGRARRGPATDPVRTYAVRVEGEDVYVETGSRAGKSGAGKR